MIRLLLLLYPRAWRERYGDEVADLAGAEGLRFSDALDVAREGVRARLLATARGLNRGHRHPTAWAIVGLVLLLPTAAFVAGSLAAYQLGLVALRGAMDRVAGGIQSLPALDLLLAAAPLVALVLAALPLVRVGRVSDGDGAAAVVQVSLRWANVAVIGVALALEVVLAWYVAGEVVLATSR